VVDRLTESELRASRGIEIEMYPFGFVGMVLFVGGTIVAAIVCAFALCVYLWSLL
jgi:hypothetical protein